MKKLLFINLLCFVFMVNTHAQDPQQGLRAAWMKGAWGVLWLPETGYNGRIEGVTIDEFVDQIKDLRTLDYVQLGLTSPNIYSPVHNAPHDIIESLWEGDIDESGDPINLVVPRSPEDPFLSWLQALKAAGLRVEVYVNSYNLLARTPESLPEGFPDLSDRWMTYCDTNSEFQDFINSQSYHTGIWNSSTGQYEDVLDTYPRRKYMFCYAEFILKEYAVRYGDLIDAWCFDSADNIMEDECGDNPDSDLVEEQRIYEAFANACHAGNPNAAIAFNNSVGDRVDNPFSTATYFDDYTFGHPFGGAGDMVENETLYTYNFHVIEWMRDNAGYAFRDDTRDWNDHVVSHFFPKQSTTSWNAGAAPCLTDDQFVEWTSTGLIDGGAITWGTPLVITNLANDGYNLTLRSYALDQLQATDKYLQSNQFVGQPNWSRQSTVLADAYVGQTYYCELVNGVDFWDTDNDAAVVLVHDASLPSWLTISESPVTPGNYILSGMPTDTEANEYTFSIKVADEKNEIVREVNLQVLTNTSDFINPGDGSPVWHIDDFNFESADVDVRYSQILILGKDFYDFEADDLTISFLEPVDWLSIVELSPGVWELYGTPVAADEGDYSFILQLSDGTQSATKEALITVNQPIWELSDNYQRTFIHPTASTDYGVDHVATMYSDVITAPDGLATFQISVDVMPGVGKAIYSGTSGGATTSQSWGLGGDGRDATKDSLFYGDAADWVELSNIQLLNFKANGGDLCLSDFEELVFDSVVTINAQSGGSKDAVAYTVNGTTTNLFNTSSNIDTIDVPNVRHLSLGVGTVTNPTKNKWSVAGLGVAYSLGTFYSVNIESEHGVVEQNPCNQTAFRPGTEVELLAISDDGYEFEGWSGDIEGSTIDGNTLVLQLDTTKNIIATFSLATGIDAVQNPLNFTISPNPSQDVFHINLDSNTYYGTYSVYSLNGTAVKSGVVSGSFDLNLSELEKGVYMFELKTKLGTDVRKIILN